MAANNFATRVLSALILAPVALGLTWAGGLPFRMLAVVTSGAILYEWLGMFGRDQSVFWKGCVVATLVLTCVALLFGLTGAAALAMIVGFYIVLAVIASVTGRRGGALSHALAFGFLYSALPALAMIAIRGSEAGGLAAILFLFAVVWGTDIFAYFTGKAIGGPKLAPAISPGKTWSGAIGGALLASLCGFIVVSIHAGGLVWTVLPIALLLSIASQLGDLFESGAKRRAGVKDSGHLIPGHGGVLDRVDGLVVAAVCLYAIGLSLGGFDVFGKTVLLQR
ncbi:phosphatidate cytidylyltransferase [Notoacmeibacter sp. MSK16QG-6]|uniref:phosphatidate cytidylyltransferase n=1 Tax=Notoacmeibacter sp. MSK16QG-6 TaxID=2957982 RepID=UPI00209E3BF1|nr:phosphatidate cytidylyltransferase [Notoacmeibacter sp. MSK16QG-6]MCP1199347.1 phosphatidate cytidylyltransferase [Notoacmeibacter sp. MSK16QG-6]